MARTSYALLAASLVATAMSARGDGSGYKGGSGGGSKSSGGGSKSGGGGGSKSAGGKGGYEHDSSSEEAASAGPAEFYGLCVDSSYWYISQDGVDGSYTEMYPAGGRADGWSSVTGFQVETITADTVLKVTCQNTGDRMLDLNGLFIGSITYDSVDYYTSESMADGLWEVVDTTAGSLEMSKFCPKVGVSVQDVCLGWNPTGDALDGPVSGGQVDWSDGKEHINSAAEWVWNDARENTLTFQFRFSRVVGAAEKFEIEIESEDEAFQKGYQGKAVAEEEVEMDEEKAFQKGYQGKADAQDEVEEDEEEAFHKKSQYTSGAEDEEVAELDQDEASGYNPYKNKGEFMNDDDTSGQVLAAIVASWQSSKALEWSGSMTLLAVASLLVALLYALRQCTKSGKDSAYQPIATSAAEEEEVC